MVKNLDGEIWKDIEGYEGKYQVSNKGRVKSLARHTDSSVECCNEGKIKTPIKREMKNGSCYLRTVLCDNGNEKSFYIHRLVAMAFIPNPDNKATVNHIDGNKSNNNVENLEWMTTKENNRHARRTGLMPSQKGMQVRTIYQFDEEGNLLNTFPNMREAARQTGIANQNISLGLKNGWHFGGFVWCYSDNFKEDEEKKKRVCPICGKEFIQCSSNQKYCSKECIKKVKREQDRERRKRERKEKETVKICKCCGKEFIHSSLNRKYCCEECREIYKGNRKKIKTAFY